MKIIKYYGRNLASLIFLLIISSSISRAQTVVLFDNFESGITNWTLTGTWGLTTNDSYSGSNSLTESPNGNYGNMKSMTATLTNGINLSGYLGAELSFWGKYSIEKAFDYMYLEISKDGGSTYSTIDKFTGDSLTWTKFNYNIGGLAGYANVKVRFRFVSDQAVNKDGMYIDDFKITASNTDNSAPLIIHNGPQFYEGTLGDFSVIAEISDASGVAAATLYYNVDGTGPIALSQSSISGDTYTFIIPKQSAGSNVSYKIKAVDSSPAANETDTSTAPVYRYISGSYLSYDDAGVDALAKINNQLKAAVRITVPNGLYGFLKTALIRNYTDSNNPNNDMLFHVWDNNNGVPGNDLITPFLVTPEATLNNPYPFTRIDLRNYSEQLADLTGDFFIGITVPQGTVNLLVSNNSSGRSLSFDGTSWAAYNKDYEFRAIIDESQDPLPVELTTFNAVVNESKVNLFWQTATEVNNYGFYIERAPFQNVKATTRKDDWTTVGFVNGHGNSNSPQKYSFIDGSVLPGKYYYRLKQIDNDGGFEYSEFILATISAPKDFVLSQNYPNPFNPSTKIKYSIPEGNSGIIGSKSVELTIYDALGKKVRDLVNENQSPGNYEIEFNAGNLPSGLYFYRLKVGSMSQIKKMILMK